MYLMSRLFKNGRVVGESYKLQGLLRQAQFNLKAMPEYSNPFYWAPFIMIDD